MKDIKVGLLGCGTVGVGVAKILLEKKDLLAARVGAPLILKHVADLDDSDRGVRFDEGVFITDAFKVVEDPDIDIVIEMIGGEGVAADLILKAIDNGKGVVTANKALLAKKGNRLCEAAMEKGVDLAFEASVGGCMPVIKTLRENLVGNRVEWMTGILNGTCNYILTKISDEGVPFETALRQAQEKGFAEADPFLDVEGHDTAHKLAIISSLAYGMKLNFDDIFIEGISGITPLDIEFASQFGYRIKLLAISKNNGDSVEARVHPTMIPSEKLLSNVNGRVNALSILGDESGEMLLYGYGAGMKPTASAVIGDVVDLARNILTGAENRMPVLAFQTESLREIPILPIEEITTRYYFRFSAMDRPGVLSKISGVLGKHDISLKSVHQKGRKTEGPVPIVMLTHLAKETNVKQALAGINDLDVVISDETVVIRIEE
ncbi:MAG: homoserine dehydrogenase [Desulfobacterales bacterium]|nr:homoserine dehydrogenase [Desulfobacterales bacterium]